MIGHRIVVTVLSIGRDQVRLGIEAPADVEVHREEVYRSIQQANRTAAESGGDLGQLAGVLAGAASAAGGGAAGGETAGAADRPGGGRAPAGHEADRSEVATNGTATP